MTRTRPDIAAYLLAALVVIVAAVIIISGHDVPTWFEPLAIFAAGGGAGAAVGRAAPPAA